MTIDVFNVIVGDSLNIFGTRWEFLAFERMAYDVRECLVRDVNTGEVQLVAVQNTPRGLVAHREIFALGAYAYDLTAIQAQRRYA